MTDTLTSFTRDDLVFDVIDQGPREGEIVVLLHGFPQLNTSWKSVAAQLNTAGYRTIAPNQRGYAEGARPRGRRPYKINELVADIAELIDTVGSPVHLVGHDWGAVVAWAVAMQHPDKLTSLTAISVPHPSAFMKAMPKGQFKDSWYMAAFNIPFLPERLLTNPKLANGIFASKKGVLRSVADDYIRDFASNRDRIKGGLAYYRALPLTNPRSLTKVTVPTTYIWSDDDIALGRAGAELCGDYVTADYRFEIIEGASHWLPDEEPERVANLILERIRG